MKTNKPFFKNLFFAFDDLPVVNKAWEAQLYISEPFLTNFKVLLAESNFSGLLFKSEVDLFGLLGYEARLTRKTDHAGLYLHFTFPFFNFAFSIYDIRHWNFEQNDWEDYTLEG